MSRDAQAVRETIRGFVLRELLPGESPDELTDDLSLKDTGILNSESTLQFVAFVEDTFGIELAPHEAATAFDRIEDIVALVMSK